MKTTICFKSIENPTLIDLILTNKWRSFQNSTVIETGLSDHHKLTIMVTRCFFQKQPPITILYRDYKNFNFKVNYDIFEEIVIRLLSIFSPIKERYIRANNSPFMNKTLSKAMMTRSRLRKSLLRILLQKISLTTPSMVTPVLVCLER